MDYNNRIDWAYGRAYLDEDEHILCEQEIRNFCDEHKIKFFYYRNLKIHHPMWREFKIEGPIFLLKKFDDEFCKFVERSQRNNDR